MTSHPPPIPPKPYDLLQAFDAMALGTKPTESERLLPEPVAKQESSFIGGFNPKLLVNTMLDATKRPSIDRERPLPPLPKSPVSTIPSPQTGKQSLTMRHALNAIDTSSCPPLTPPFIASQSRHSNSHFSPGATLYPSISTGVRSPPRLDITPTRPRAASVPLSPLFPSANKNTARCNSRTKAGKQCSREVKLPSTHSHIDPIPVVYCYQHRDLVYAAQPGFFVRQKGKEDTFVEFSDYIPQYLQRDTQLALRVEMEKSASTADGPGYIYTYEIRGSSFQTFKPPLKFMSSSPTFVLDPKRPSVIQLKVGRSVNIVKRLDQWDKQCGSKVQIVRGWWPSTVEDDSDDDGTNGSLLKGSIKTGNPGPLYHRVERLVHIELADLVVHTPYLNPKFPKVDDSALPSSCVGSPKSKKAAIKPCPDCGAMHREIFAFPRPEEGKYKGREWELLVKPVIEKWGRFVSEYYA